MSQSTDPAYLERFYARLLRRQAAHRPQYEAQLEAASAGGVLAESTSAGVATRDRVIVLETIVSEERPVLFVEQDRFLTNASEYYEGGLEARTLVEELRTARGKLQPMLPLVGRIDVENFPNMDYVGTGWFLAENIVITNRHVAELVARWDGRRYVIRAGVAGQPLVPTWCSTHEGNDSANPPSRSFRIEEVLYIEPTAGPDLAFVRVSRRADGTQPVCIPLAETNLKEDEFACVVGYPARAPARIIPDQELMQKLYRDRYDIKRAAPGYGAGEHGKTTTHDCTTLGGNSGSVLLNAAGQAAGLHFAGLYRAENYAVPASVLREYVRGQRWNRPAEITTTKPETQTREPTMNVPPSTNATPSTNVTTYVAAGTYTFELNIPIQIQIGVRSPVLTPVAAGTSSPPPVVVDVTDPAQVEAAAVEYWKERSDGVLAVRVGYLDADGQISEQLCLAVSVQPSRWSAFEKTAPRIYRGLPVRYAPADVQEQLDAIPEVESVNRIAYDDDARTGPEFSFDEVDEEMHLRLHVGPEYSWDELKKFLDATESRLVGGMYEFHARHIQETLEERLSEGAEFKLVLDNATFSGGNDPESFDRPQTFERWANDYTFERIVAPEGTSGLISDSYHIKVVVRDGKTFWLSSGNWKAGSSQPMITPEQRRAAATTDLPGNREWHVTVRNTTLARRFQQHLEQDFQRSTDLNGGVSPESAFAETSIEIPEEVSLVLERRAPSKILKPKVINRRVKVKMLLTPDQQGKVYSEAVLGLIESAQSSLFFQIPYIGMPSAPGLTRGYIDRLIVALTKKLKTLDDARVILRTGGSALSAPAHAAWYFKSKGVDIDNRLRAIENHHTKGMIVDGRRVLLGSHNWSKPGVSLNRDASLLFDDADVAQYYTEAFEIDWARANPIRPRQFVRPESFVTESAADGLPLGYRTVSLQDALQDA